MDSRSQSSYRESSPISEISLNNGLVHHSDQPEEHCALCWKLISPDNEVNSVHSLDVCSDCRVAYLANIDNTIPESHQRRTSRGRRDRYDSSESIEDVFSQQFSHLINLVRQNQHSSPISASEQEPQLVDGETSAGLSQPMSSRTTPNGSRRWWRSVSDNESEGFDNLDSVYGENESVNSFGGYGAFHGEGDTVSHSVYGAGSDISVDVHSYMDRDLFTQQDNGSDIDSDTDIDPMQAGLDQWDSDDQDDENEGWGENSAEENSVTLSRNSNDYSDSSNWIRRLQGRRNGVSIEWRVQESRLSIVPNTSGNYVGNSGDYLDASGFEQLLEQLAEADSTRRGAPPAAASFVDSLPSVSINAGHVKHDDLVCAVCKDCFSIGNVVKQLPCMHLYHPSCILPWLSARNSCPLCRYELPTDDKDYEEGKHARVRTTIQEIADSESSGESEEDLSDEETETEHGELMNVDCDDMQRRGRRGGWFFLPIVSLVGFVLVCWFRKPVVGQRGNCVVQRQGQLSVSTVGQGRNRGRRWWSLF